MRLYGLQRFGNIQIEKNIGIILIFIVSGKLTHNLQTITLQLQPWQIKWTVFLRLWVAQHVAQGELVHVAV